MEWNRAPLQNEERRGGSECIIVIYVPDYPYPPLYSPIHRGVLERGGEEGKGGEGGKCAGCSATTATSADKRFVPVDSKT